MGSGNLRGLGRYLLVDNKPKFRQFCNLSCAASAAHLQAGAAKCCELGAAKCTQVRRVPPRSTGGGVIFGFDKLLGFNLRGEAYFYAY